MSKISIPFTADLLTGRELINVASTMRDLVAVAHRTKDKCAEVDGDYMYNQLMEDFFWKFINSTSHIKVYDMQDHIQEGVKQDA